MIYYKNIYVYIIQKDNIVIIQHLSWMVNLSLLKSEIGELDGLNTSPKAVSQHLPASARIHNSYMLLSSMHWTSTILVLISSFM